MTTLYPEDTPPPVVFLMAHLSALSGGVGQTYIEGTDLTTPFRQVSLLDIHPDDGNLYTDAALLSVHTFSWARTPEERAQARINAADTDRRIMLLSRNPLIDVTMPDMSIANCDYLELVEKQALRPYGVNTIHRYVGRYRIGLAYVAVS